jgi:hypothetical protein
MRDHKLIMFPEGEHVFFDRLEEHKKYLFPLFSIDLSHVNPEWNGLIHMLDYNEDPYNQETVSSFNEFCNEDQICFDIKDNRYSLKTSFDYFECSDDWKPYFHETQTEYSQTKAYYRENNKLPNYLGKPGTPYEQIGGEPEWIQGDQTPLDPDGNRMTFIARVYNSNFYVKSGGKDIYLFYSDKFKLAVLLYQGT